MLRLNFLYLNFCSYCSFTGPFGNIGISMVIDVGIIIAKILFCLSKFQFLSFKVYYEVKHPWWSPIYNMQIFLEDFSCYLEQLFCREPISACFWRKELHHGRYFRSFKNTEGGSLQVCQFLIRKRWKLNSVNLQLLLKGDFSKFLGKALFGTYHDARVRFFSAVLQNVKSFLSLLKCDSTKDAFPGILKFLRTNKGNTCGRISFRHSYRIGQLEFLKGTLLKTFFGNFPKLS